MRISDWSSDVCSSDLLSAILFSVAYDQQIAFQRFDEALRGAADQRVEHRAPAVAADHRQVHMLVLDEIVEQRFGRAVLDLDVDPRSERRIDAPVKIGRASCRERVFQYV